jgi:hypothetical protein
MPAAQKEQHSRIDLVRSSMMPIHPLLRPRGEGFSPQGVSPMAQALMRGPQARGPNYGRMGGGILGMGVSTPMAQGYNPNYGQPSPMMSRAGAGFAPAAPQAPQPNVQWSNPDIGDGYSDPGDQPGMGGFGGWT